MQIRILMKSDTGRNPYQVLLELSGSDIRFACDCPDGLRGRLCKHCLRAISGSVSAVYDRAGRHHLAAFQESIADTELQRLAIRWADADEETQRAKERADALRRQIEQGFEVGTGHSGIVGHRRISVVPTVPRPIDVAPVHEPEP